MPDPIAAIRAEVARMRERADADKEIGWPWCRADNQAFIAAARSDVPRLVALVEALCELVELGISPFSTPRNSQYHIARAKLAALAKDHQ